MNCANPPPAACGSVLGGLLGLSGLDLSRGDLGFTRHREGHQGPDLPLSHQRGTVITGRIERGIVKVTDTVDIIGIRDTKQTTTVTGIEMFRKLLDEGQAGENVGLLLRGTKREDVERGMVIIAPGSTTPHTEFEGQAYILSKEEGGRHTPFFNNYRPQFYFRTTDVTGAVELPADKEMVMPGDNVSITVKLINPIAMEEGLRFAIREGGRTVGAGVVAKIIA